MANLADHGSEGMKKLEDESGGGEEGEGGKCRGRDGFLIISTSPVVIPP